MCRDFKVLDVSVLQLKSYNRYQKNFDTFLKYLEIEEDTNIIVAPEVFLTAYDYEHMATAAKFSANALKILKKIVDNQIVVFTLILEEDNTFVNQALVIHKHKIVHRQNKVKLFRLGNEDLYFKAGKKKKVKPFVINDIKYAVLICFELRFKELWTQIEGADIVIIPARWGKERKNQLEILTRALAVMNQCYVVVANSSDNDMACSSAIIKPNGDMLKNDSKNLIEGKIDLREIKKMRRYIVMD